MDTVSEELLKKLADLSLNIIEGPSLPGRQHFLRFAVRELHRALYDYFDAEEEEK